MKLIPFLRLFRKDAAIISFGSYMAGAFLAGKAGWTDWLTAGMLTAFSTNFCYSFNSWADREVDRVNKPLRPIPAGEVAPRQALLYSMFLLVCALIFPFFISRNPFTLSLFLLIPLLGFFYSAKPVFLKNRPPWSILVVATGLVLPIILGYTQNLAGWHMAGFFTGLYLFILSLISLKDIEDKIGDSELGLNNLYDKYGDRLPVWSQSGLMVAAASVLVLPVPIALRIWMILLVSTVFAVIQLGRRPGNPLTALYGRVIKAVLWVGSLLLLWLFGVLWGLFPPSTIGLY